MITSAQNPKIQRLRALLADRKQRLEENVCLAEGVRLVEEGLGAGWVPELVVTSEGLSARGVALGQRCRQQGSEVEEISSRLMQSISSTETPQGILAVLPIKHLPVPEALTFALIADGLRDPGNLGTLLRTAAAAGVQAVFLTPGTTDAFSPKVLRAGMGAHFRLPIHSLTWEEIHTLCKNRPAALKLFLAEASQGAACWQLDLRQPVAIIIGSEAEGASQAARAAADGMMTIPMPGQSESLNAAAAAAVLLFEVVRQRCA